ncbi:MAG: DNA recombination protein RmuC [Patescibacteria group bacterium]
MSTLFQIVLIILVLAGFGAVIFILSKKENKDINQDDKLKEMRDEIGKIKDEMKGSLEKNLEFIQKQSFQTGDIIKDVTSKLERLESTNKQVVDFTGQLKNLEQVLTNSKNRGSLGEAGLEMILNNILPPGSFQMQYHFKNSEAVDAVVFIKDKILPVDAKFSLENYRRIINEKDESKKVELEKVFKNDLKKRIDETAKYIRPQENTLDFAFMFIPAEGIYYDLLVNEIGAVKVNTRSLIDYAFNEKKVIIVSPTTFSAYLQTVLQGLKALQIEESAKEIRNNVEKLGKHILSFEEYMKKLGNNLGTTVNMYNSAYKELNKIDKDVIKITDGEKTIDPLVLDKPKIDE